MREENFFFFLLFFVIKNEKRKLFLFYLVFCLPSRINGNKSDSDSDEDYNCTAFMSSSSVQLASLTLLEKIKRPYRVWFKLNINAYPGKPVKTLFASCHVYSSTNIEMPLKNPLDQELCLNVIINGIGLNGKNVLTLPPLGSDFYQISFSPVTIGKQKAR